MERKLLDLDLAKMLLTLKENLKAYKHCAETVEELKKVITELKNPSFGKLLHIQDIADLLNVTHNTIYRYIKSGELASIKIGNRHVFYEKDLKDFLDKNHSHLTCCTCEVLKQKKYF